MTTLTIPRPDSLKTLLLEGLASQRIPLDTAFRQA
jgi:hypothetical protein